MVSSQVKSLYSKCFAITLDIETRRRLESQVNVPGERQVVSVRDSIGRRRRQIHSLEVHGGFLRLAARQRQQLLDQMDGAFDCRAQARARFQTFDLIRRAVE